MVICIYLKLTKCSKLFWCLLCPRVFTSFINLPWKYTEWCHKVQEATALGHSLHKLWSPESSMCLVLENASHGTSRNHSFCSSVRWGGAGGAYVASASISMSFIISNGGLSWQWIIMIHHFNYQNPILWIIQWCYVDAEAIPTIVRDNICKVEMFSHFYVIYTHFTKLERETK